MDAYEKYHNAESINRILDTINDMYKDMFAACHGRYHTMFVVDTVEYILTSLSYDARTIELGKIAALLHDIGNITGRWKHASMSAALAAVYLDGPVYFSPEEKEMIVHAIEDHSDGNDISSAIGAALIIADKMDISRRRILPLGNTSSFYKEYDAWHNNLLEIENMDVYIANKTITINCITTEAFIKDVFVNGYLKRFSLSIKAAKHLGCTYHFQFNGKEEIIDC